MRRLATCLGLCVAGWALCAPTASASPAPERPSSASVASKPSAAPKPNAKTDRLVGLTRSDLERLAPQLQRGPVALIEFADTDTDALPGIHIATRVNAPAAKVLEVVRDPAGYPRFLPTLDEVEVQSTRGQTLVYDWRWAMAVLSFEGRNTMTVYEPPPARAADGYRVTIESQSGDFGAGRTSIRIWPTSDTHSTLLISMRMDLREANYVARQLAVAARSVNRSANIALTYAMLLGFRGEAERRAGVAIANQGPRGLVAPEVSVRAVLPLLLRGDVVFLELAGSTLERVAVLGLLYHPRALVRETMLDAKSFGASLMPGASARVLSRSSQSTTFAWEIDLPLVGVGGQMEMGHEEVIDIRATQGALAGGRWLFDTRALRDDTTLLTAWARFDLSDSAWLVRRLAEVDKNLGHGLTVASEVMLVRALRSRSRKRAEELSALPAK